MDLLLNLILNFPFFVVAYVIFTVIRALVKGEVQTGRFGGRTIYLSSNPIRFWIEMVLYLIFGTFMFLIGLLCFNCAPHWFYEFIKSAKPQRH